MRVIDAHVHWYPPKVATDPVAWARARGETWWEHCVAPAERPSIQGWATTEQMLHDMDEAGVERGVLQGWYWERQETCDEQNAWYAKLIRQHPDRISAFAAVQPASGTRALDAARRALDSGFCGLGESHPHVQGVSMQEDAWGGLMELAREAGVPVNLHVTDPVVGVGSPGDPWALSRYVQLAKDFPDNVLIFAHWGGGLPFYEMNVRVKATLKNVYYDTAASPLLYRPDIFRRVVEIIGADRIIHGSDYPLLLFPGRTRTPDFSSYLGQVRSETGLDDQSLEKMLGGNLRRLLKLN